MSKGTHIMKLMGLELDSYHNCLVRHSAIRRRLIQPTASFSDQTEANPAYCVIQQTDGG